MGYIGSGGVKRMKVGEEKIHSRSLPYAFFNSSLLSFFLHHHQGYITPTFSMKLFLFMIGLRNLCQLYSYYLKHSRASDKKGVIEGPHRAMRWGRRYYGSI